MAVGAGSRAGTGTDGHALMHSGSLCRSEAIAGVSARAWRGRSSLLVDYCVRVQYLFLCISSGHLRACIVDNKWSPLALEWNT